MKIINKLFRKPSSGRISTQDLVYFEMKQMIIEGKLEPYQPLNEKELSSELGVSRTPLRSALQALEFDNLVERQSNGRVKVAPVSIQEAKEIFIVRSKLEEIAVEQATENVTDDDINELTNIVYMIQQAHKIGDIEDVLYYGDTFHSYIYEISKNKTVINIMSQLNVHVHRYLRLLPNQKSIRITEDYEEHELILKHIANRDKQAAKLAMKKHIEHSLESAIDAIKTSKYYKEIENKKV